MDQLRDELLTVDEVAKILKISPRSVARRFENLPGVVDVGPKVVYGRNKRLDRTLRIPSAVLLRFLHEHRLRK